MAIKGFNVPGTPSGWLAIAFRNPAKGEWIIDGIGKPMQWNWDDSTQWFVIIRKIELNEQELEAEYRDCQCEAVWFERLLVAGAVAIGLAVLYFCGAWEWIEG
jgi:hypothetical protein